MCVCVFILHTLYLINKVVVRVKKNGKKYWKDRARVPYKDIYMVNKNKKKQKKNLILINF